MPWPRSPLWFCSLGATIELTKAIRDGSHVQDSWPASMSVRRRPQMRIHRVRWISRTADAVRGDLFREGVDYAEFSMETLCVRGVARRGGPGWSWACCRDRRRPFVSGNGDLVKRTAGRADSGEVMTGTGLRRVAIMACLCESCCWVTNFETIDVSRGVSCVSCDQRLLLEADDRRTGPGLARPWVIARTIRSPGPLGRPGGPQCALPAGQPEAWRGGSAGSPGGRWDGRCSGGGTAEGPGTG